MKIGKLSWIALLGGALLAPSYADKVQLEQLPADLQAKIRAQTGGARIEDIDRDVRNGKTTYEVAFKNPQGQNTELVFEDTGNLAGAENSTTLDSRKIKYSELPVPVRRSADAQIAGGEVNDVERKVRNGRVTYGIGFKGPNGTGPQRELVLDSQGNILRGRRANASATASSTVNGATSSSSSRAIAYNELPQSVRSVAESHLNKGEVENVERRWNNGQISYFINFKKEDGQYQQMVIAENGQILSNQLVAAGAAGLSAAGASATAQSGATSSSQMLTQAAQYNSIHSRVPMQNSTVVDRSQVPPEVRRTIRDATQSGNVEEILKGDWSGKPVYQVAFTDENKKYAEVQLDSAGQVIYDTRSNTSPAAATTPSTTGNILQNIGRALLDGQNK